MSAYQKKWLELLKQQNISGQIMEHGQAIIIYLPSEASLKNFYEALPDTIASLSPAINTPKEWLKIILYNNRSWLQYIIKPA